MHGFESDMLFGFLSHSREKFEGRYPINWMPVSYDFINWSGLSVSLQYFPDHHVVIVITMGWSPLGLAAAGWN